MKNFSLFHILQIKCSFCARFEYASERGTDRIYNGIFAHDNIGGHFNADIVCKEGHLFMHVVSRTAETEYFHIEYNQTLAWYDNKCCADNTHASRFAFNH